MPWSVSKGHDSFLPLSTPFTLAPGEDWKALRLWLEVNGEWRQACEAGAMIHSVPQLLCFISSVMTLERCSAVTRPRPAAARAATHRLGGPPACSVGPSGPEKRVIPRRVGANDERLRRRPGAGPKRPIPLALDHLQAGRSRAHRHAQRCRPAGARRHGHRGRRRARRDGGSCRRELTSDVARASLSAQRARQVHADARAQ